MIQQRLSRGIVLLALLVASFVPVVPAAAAPADVLNQGGCSNTSLCSGSSTGIFTTIQGIIQILLMVSGIVAVIMIIVGGIMYSVSVGDPAKAKKAKDTVLYSVVGLVVAVMSYAIVGFVLGKL